MRIATLLLAFAIPFTATQAQSRDVIRPGDILILKFQDKWWFAMPEESYRKCAGEACFGREGIQRTVVVADDGKITAPWLEGTKSLKAFSVESLTLDQAAQKLQQEYIPAGKFFPAKIVIERGTVGQLLHPNSAVESPR
jgi:hypothetical protein